MSTITVTVGLPASGKTTWAKAQNQPIVSRDDIRRELTGNPHKTVLSREDEARVTKIQRERVKEHIRAGRDVIVADTNLVGKFQQEWVKLAVQIGAAIQFVEFPVPLVELLERNDERPAYEHVPASVIIDMFERNCNEDGTFKASTPDTSHVVAHEYKPYVRGPWPAISVDLDGTLALNLSGRGWYDKTKYDQDTPHEAIRSLIYEAYHKFSLDVIILTAREGTKIAQEQTLAWLKKHDIPYSKIFFRAEGDTRDDGIVKSEIIDQHISNVYDVKFHLDDRNRVVQALRRKGYPVWQVADGNF